MFQISESKYVFFASEDRTMVPGYPEHAVVCYLVDTCSMSLKSLSIEDAKKYYRKLSGRSERINYWRDMREFINDRRSNVAE